MKGSLTIFSFIILVLISCEKDKIYTQSDPQQEIITQDSAKHDYILKIGTSLGYDYNEVELYDSSTHILYFKTCHPEFEKLKNESFAFFADGDTIYKGNFWPTYFSSLPAGPYISNNPSFYQNYALRIEDRGITKPDLRNDPRLIQALNVHSLLHSGLSLKINSIECGVSKITFSFSITNKDKSTLLILDPEKMGLNIFHYFTNGLVIRKIPWAGSYITVKITSQTPSPWNGWKSDWLSGIVKDETKTFVIDYPIDTPLSPGAYNVSFEYPGLHYQVSKEELIQNTGRIWLGSLEAKIDFVIE